MTHAFPTRRSSDLFRCNFRHAPSLIAGADQFRLAGLAATIAISDRGRAIGRSTPYFIHAGLACIAILQTDNGHAEMQQIRSEERRVGKECASTCRSRLSAYQ